MHKIAIDARSISSGTMSTLMREIGNDAIDASRYESVDRMSYAFVDFVDSMVATAKEMRIPFPYQSWQDLWAPFLQTRYFYDGIGAPTPTDEERREQAAAMGFSSIGEMDTHQHWLDRLTVLGQAARRAVARAGDTGVIDARDTIPGDLAP